MLVLVTGGWVMRRHVGPHWEHIQLVDIEYVRTGEPFKVSAQKAFLALATSVIGERFFRWLTGVDFGVMGVVGTVVGDCCCCCSAGCCSVVLVPLVFTVIAGRILVLSEIHG